MNKLPDWLRWTLCIPAALFAFLIVNGMNRITFLTLFGDPITLLFRIGTILIEGTVGVMALLYVLYIVTPSNKKTTIIVASILIGILSLLSAILQIIYPNSITPLWQIVTPAILSIGSCLYFYKIVWKGKKILLIDSSEEDVR